MESGEFDLYPEYTGTGWNMVLKRDSLYSEDQFEELQKEYQDKLGLTWDVMLGFNDTYGIAVRKEIADQYGLKTYSSDMDMGLKYQAINSGKIDIMPVNTTDGQLSQADVTVLEDDKQMYPSYQCGIVVRQEILDKYPELQTALRKFDTILTEADMQEMNYEVETEKKEPADVAKAFLTEKGLVK